MNLKILKIPFWTEVTKPRTESCAEKNCYNNQTGIVCKKVVLVKVAPGFQSFPLNHERSVKNYCPG